MAHRSALPTALHRLYRSLTPRQREIAALIAGDALDSGADGPSDGLGESAAHGAPTPSHLGACAGLSDGQEVDTATPPEAVPR